MQAKSSGGVLAATMAFGVSGGGCSLGGGLEANLSGAGKTDIVNFQAAGGRVILSFGGASGTYLESACSDDGMFNLVKSVLDTTGARAIDFDVEGNQISSAALEHAAQQRGQAAAGGVPRRCTSRTRCRSIPTGLPSEALTVIRSANAAGVKVSMVNIMAMDYGDADQARMGELAISAANATFKQIKAIFTGKTDAQLWAMIGVTPMIGVNDTQSEVFRQADATELATFAQQKGLGLLSYWALQRDMPGGSDYNDFSLVNTKAYEFYKILAGGQGHAAGRAGRRHLHDRVGLQRQVRRHRRRVHRQLGAGAAVPVQRHRRPEVRRHEHGPGLVSAAQRQQRQGDRHRVGLHRRRRQGAAVHRQRHQRAALLDQAGRRRHHLRDHQRRQRQVPGRGRLEHQRQRQDPAVDVLRHVNQTWRFTKQ